MFGRRKGARKRVNRLLPLSLYKVHHIITNTHPIQSLQAKKNGCGHETRRFSKSADTDRQGYGQKVYFYTFLCVMYMNLTSTSHPKVS